MRHLLKTRFGQVQAIVAALVLAFAVIVGEGQLSNQQGQLSNQQDQIHAIIQHELANRVKNVAHWCDGINATRDYQRELVAGVNSQFHVNIPFTLGDLPCAQIEQATQASAH